MNKRSRDSLESSSKSVSFGEPCDRQRVCPTQQLPPDAERITSQRRPFLRPFPRLCPPSGYRSRPLVRRNESDLQPSPQRSFARQGSPRARQNSLTLRLAAPSRVNGKPRLLGQPPRRAQGAGSAMATGFGPASPAHLAGSICADSRVLYSFKSFCRNHLGNRSRSEYPVKWQVDLPIHAVTLYVTSS